MAVIDVLKLVFDADASGMQRGTQQAKDSTDGLKDSVIETDQAAQDLGDSFLGMVSGAKGALVGLVGVSSAVAGILSEAARVTQLRNFSEVLGENIEDVDAWGQAVIRQGGTAEGFQSTLKGLTNSLTQLQLTGGGPAAEALAKLGISARNASGNVKSAFYILEETASAFEGLSLQESLIYGQSLGIDTSTILLLQQGRIEVGELVRRQRELGVATAESAEVSKDFTNAWQDMRQVFMAVFRDIGLIVLPALTSMMNGLTIVVDFLRDNSSFVEGVFIGLASVIAYKLTPAFVGLLTTLLPFAIIAGLILLFGLLYDDIENFLAGNESMIGEISKKYPMVGKIVEGLATFFGNLADNFSRMFKAIEEGNFIQFWLDEIEIFKKEMSELFDYINNFGKIVNNKIDEITPDLPAIFEKTQKFLGFGDDQPEPVVSIGGTSSSEDIVHILNKEITEDITEDITNIENLSNVENLSYALITANDVLSSATANPMNSSGNQSITNATSSIQKNTSLSTGDININAPGADSTEIAANVGNEMNTQFSRVISNYDDGVEG